jgi:nitroreductase
LLKKNQLTWEGFKMDAKSLFEERRAVNFFDTTKNLEDETLKDIINLATLAPSAFNLQPGELIAVKSDESKEKLKSLAFNQDKITEAPVTLIVISNKEAYSVDNPVWGHLEKAMGTDAVKQSQETAKFLYGSTEERKIKFAESNAGLLSMSIMYAAKSHGVDSHAMSGMDFDAVKKEFNIDDNKEVVMLIALGYHDKSKELFPRGYRKNYDSLVKEV